MNVNSNSRWQNRYLRCVRFLTLWALFALFSTSPDDQATCLAQSQTKDTVQLESAQARQLRRITSAINNAERKYVADDFAGSATTVNRAIETMTELLASATPEQLPLVKPQYDRLERAIELLGTQSQSTQPIPPLAAGATRAPSGDGRTPNGAANNPADANPSDDDQATGPSFVNDVAPLIVEKCSGCHLNTRRVRGGLDLSTFERLMRGGDNGAIVVAGNSAGSELVKRLKLTGSGSMPPGDPLTAEQIRRFESWIDEQAPFDGHDASASLARVISVAQASSATHEQLAQRRGVLAMENWRTVMGDAEMNRANSENFLVVGGMPTEQLQTYADAAEAHVPAIRRALRLSDDRPLVKGRVTVYLFQGRYDYSEFGKMVEKRQLPQSFTSHWGFTINEAYVVLNVGRNGEVDDFSLPLVQQISAAAVAASGGSVPGWFAGGAGRWVAAQSFPRDETVRQWQEQGETSAKRQAQPTDFIEGQIADDEAALIGYYFVDLLAEKKGSFRRLLDAIHDGGNFDESFESIYKKTPNRFVSGR